MAALSETISPNLIMINFLQGIDMSAYTPFTLVKRGSIRDLTTLPLGTISITFKSLVAQAIEEWQIIKSYKFYHGASANVDSDKTANAAQDNNKYKSKDTSRKVGKGLKDLYYIHTS